jgi:hypothetical protein
MICHRKKNKVVSDKQEIRAENDQIRDQEDVMMFRVKTALRAGPRVEC